ncbi:MAG: PucR family transcriptional regulator ligand-binding domain-containing protein [Lachnospiraceae bacterium]|nr:PucR family transcriptional regulator ligand-binding domain-containing protein [Lachnospiraceae bacterium]
MVIMAVTLARLCENANKLYGMHVLAGNLGMRNSVPWVHTLEDEEVCTFLHGGELVFTTGIGHRDTSWLLSFTQNLYAAEASGLVVNYGPYIEKVPAEVINYCNEVNFPLLVVPWKTRLVDITRDFCNQIIQNEKIEDTVGEAFQKMILNPSESEPYISILERHNYKSWNFMTGKIKPAI